MTAKAHIDRDDLFRRYVVEREGASSIASSMGVSTRVVTRRLNEHGIAQRSQSEANALRTLSDAARAKSSAAGKGRVTASETRAKIAAANRGRVVSEETRLLLANRQRGRPSYWTGKTLPEHVRDAFVGGHVGVPLSVEHRQKISASLTGHKHTPETRLKRSAAVSGDKNPRWGKSPSFGKWSLYTSGATGESQKMRSSWEVAVATGLDAAGIRWLYEPKRFTLTDRTYTPDFFLPDLGIYWEVKGWFQPRDQETIRRFRMECPEETLVVLTKPAIQMLTKERL
ncbi:MAG TPA: NUMOD3 domain-containing DNA-binding protein [Chloroflexota bacterium]|nr:NUMOD3 domain-containing DNA-binding protein [Chloroflexota bacterium]